MCPITLPSSPTHPLQPRTLQVAWSIQLEPLFTETLQSVAGERERDSQVQGLSRRRTDKQHHESAPPNLQERGPLAPQPQSPTPSRPYLLAPTGALVDVSWQQRSAEHDGRMQTCEHWSSRGGHGEPDQDAEDQSSLFFCSRFFPEPNVLYPIFPILVRGGSVLSGVVAFFPHFFF